MKSHTRRVSILAAGLILSFSLATAVAAAPKESRDRDRDVPGKVLKLIKKVLGVTTQDSQPMPPKP